MRKFSDIDLPNGFVVPAGARALQLTKGFVGLVDAEDYTRLSGLGLLWSMNAGYAYNATLGLLHRYLMQPPAEAYVDHVNGNRLDCRRSNMRLATNAQNQQNRKAATGKSPYKGVSWNHARNNWLARIRVDGCLKYLGSFKTDAAAAHAYDAAARKFFGPYAHTNYGAIQ